MNIEELRKKAEAAWEGCHHCDEYDKEFWINGYITGVLSNQVELPSDEEIEEIAKDYADLIGNRNGTAIFDYTKGAKWMRDKIKQKVLLKEVMEADEKDGLYDENK